LNDDDFVYNVSDDNSFDVSYGSHNSDTEQQIDSSSDEESSNSVSNEFFFGKDGTKWSKFPIAPTSRTRSHNIVTHLSDTKKHGKNDKTPLEYVLIFYLTIQ